MLEKTARDISFSLNLKYMKCKHEMQARLCFKDLQLSHFDDLHEQVTNRSFRLAYFRTNFGYILTVIKKNKSDPNILIRYFSVLYSHPLHNHTTIKNNCLTSSTNVELDKTVEPGRGLVI